MERYEAYKDSGIKWIGEIPEGWEYGRLKQRNTIAGRIGWQGLTSDEYCDEGPYLITGINFANGAIDWNTCVHITDERWEEATQIQIVEGDLLITKDGTVGKVAIAENLQQKASLNSGVMVVRPTTSKQTVRFLFWLLQSGVFWGWFSDINSGNSTIIHLYQGDFLNFDYYLPPIAEQQAIVDYLDAKTAEIDALVADCEREVGLLREYRKAVISEAVTKGLDPDAPMKDSGVEWIGEIPEGWEVVGFKTYLSGIIDYRGRTPEKVEDGVFLITGRNIKQGRVHYELSQEYMRPEDFDSIMSRGRLRIGNVLFTMEAPLGEVALIDREDCAAAQRIVQLCCKEDELYGGFLVYWIMSDEFQSDLQTYATGSTASGIKASKLGMLRLVHPPIDVQHSIADYLDAKTAEIDSLIEAKQEMADKLREYRKSLISEAVTGKFKVPGVDK